MSPEVRVHLHYAMTGSYPLRLLDLLFCPERVLVAEYDYLTGIDLVTGGADRRAMAFAETVREDGVEGALATVERQQSIPYEDVERVTVYDGGRFGREKVTLTRATADPVRVRVHGDVDTEAFVAAVRSTVDGYETAVELERGLGLDAGTVLSRLSPR